MTSWTPGDQSGQQGQQPGHGSQPQPGYGQQQPGYGQQQPGYGQQQPGYGQQPGQQSSPNFDKGPSAPPPPSYGSAAPPPPSYGQQPPAYGQNQPAYGGGYGEPQQNPYGGSPYGGNQPAAGAPVNMGNRVVAFIIDYVIFLLPIIIFYITVIASVASATSSCGYQYDSSGTPVGYSCSSAGTSLGIGGIIGIIILIAGIALDVWMIYQLGKTGQTPGKKIMGVKVVDLQSGQPIGFGRAFLRYLVQGVSNIACYAGLWSAWLDSPPQGRYRGWHDKAMNSVVISVPK